MAKNQKVKAVAAAVAGVFIKDASLKEKISAADLAVNNILQTADAQSVADMQSIFAANSEAVHLADVIAQGKADLIQCQDFGYRAIAGMRSRGMSYDGIKALWKAVSGGANLPGMLKVACSMLQNGERLGVKITPDTLRSECAKVIKAERDKAAGVKDQKNADDKSLNMAENVKGELTDAQVVKQAVALLLVSADFRQSYSKQIAEISARLAADSAKIAAGKIVEGAAAAAKRKTA